MLFVVIALLVLGYFAWIDYKEKHIIVEHALLAFVAAMILVTSFGNLPASIGIGFAFFLVLFGFEYFKITFRGDTIIGTLVAFIYPDFFVLIVSLVIGFVLTSIIYRNQSENAAFLPMFFIGFALVLLGI